MSSAETATETAEATGTTGTSAPVDEARDGLLATFRTELGDAVVGSHLVPGDTLWVRVDRSAWREAALVARDVARCTYFCFLSAIDWTTSPYGRDEDSQEDIAVTGAEPRKQVPLRTGVAGGDTRFQVFGRLVQPTTNLGVILKADLEDVPVVDSWVPVYAGADWHEREAWEMYGIEFVGHPRLYHIYLPGHFEGFPLRKDFPLLARRVKPWPGIVDVEPMPGEDAPAEGADAGSGTDAPAAVPDAEAAPAAAELTPDAPPTDAAATGDPDKKAAAAAPIPAHGEMASQDQLDEGERAAELAGGGGVDTTGIPTGEADTGRPGQGGSGQGAVDDAKVTLAPGARQPAPGDDTPEDRTVDDATTGDGPAAGGPLTSPTATAPVDTEKDPAAIPEVRSSEEPVAADPVAEPTETDASVERGDA